MRSVITTHDCPNCGSNLRIDGVTDLTRCKFCGTQIALPGRAVSRNELEMERDQLLALEQQEAAQIRQEKRRGAGDFLVPPLGCCGLYFGIFVVGALILSALGLKDAEPHTTIVAAIAISAALIGVVLIIWRREKRRTDRILAFEREWSMDRGLREKRLREIEAELEALGE